MILWIVKQTMTVSVLLDTINSSILEYVPKNVYDLMEDVLEIRKSIEMLSHCEF
jgi:hypothetical protein